MLLPKRSHKPKLIWHKRRIRHKLTRFTPRSKHFGQDKARKAQDALDAWNAAHQMWTHPITKVKHLIDKSDIHKSELRLYDVQSLSTSAYLSRAPRVAARLTPARTPLARARVQVRNDRAHGAGRRP